MPINKILWQTQFVEDELPEYPCPTCPLGQLSVVPGSFSLIEPTFSKDLHSDEAWDPEWITRRFSARLQCKSKKCGETSHMIGEIGFVEEFDPERGWTPAEVLEPKSIFPAPPIFPIPDETPENIADILTSSFELYWLDRKSSMNKVRIAIEEILEDMGVPKKQKGKENQLVDINLHQRIEIFQKQNSDAGKSFMAAKMVGNLGSHTGEDISFEVALDIFELVEDAIGEIYGEKSKKLNAIKDALIASKGKSSS